MGEGSLQYLKNVGPKRVKLLEKLGIYTIHELLYHFPRRYEDRSNLKKAHDLIHGEVETVQGIVVGKQDIKPRKGLTITKVAINDGTSIIYGVWFNQPFVKKQFPQGAKVILSGKVERKFGSIQIMVADYEVDEDQDPIHTNRIVPIYSTTEGLNQRILRTIIKTALDNYIFLFEEFLPDYLLKKYKFPCIMDALKEIHFPENMKSMEKARERFIFEELFLLQLGVTKLKRFNQEETKGIQHKINGPLVDDFIRQLPFSLTAAQKKVISEINNDMESPKPMNRLVQGDVGSGKTIVAAYGLVKTVDSGYQGAMMAPTEILAEQHYMGIKELLSPLGLKIALLTGSTPKKDKNIILNEIKNGEVNIIIGTHALIQDEVEFKNLGLAVTDEQHRFGVRQRAMLKQKGYNPDVLVMTATPIPRTLALTVYGDLDISIIDQLPPGRKPIKTYWVTPDMRPRLYKFIREQVSKGRQAYVVCPLVDESDKLAAEAAAQLASNLQNKVFPDLRVGLMHGRLKSNEKEQVMNYFRDRKIDILVSTTVVEVGVNVPNATLMVIEDAERFGLAQLHQLRGRVGRGEHQSYCVLVSNPRTDEGKARMKIMQATSDGFVIAEEDLKLRGPGEFFGTRQSGMPDLKIANILRDVTILEIARNESQKLIKENPNLAGDEYMPLKKQLKEKFKDKFQYIFIS